MVEGEKAKQPFFTIGVTTYKRRELLRQTLASILAQTFADFEVIVGNDCPDEVLNGDLFDISDPRIRFVNHPRNLQEVANMNALLAMASGRYFSWLGDDDLYQPDLLRIAHDSLVQNGFPAAFYSSYGVCLGTNAPRVEATPAASVRILSGRCFLGDYFARRLKIISVYGLFDTDKLRRVVGGVEELCASAVGLYGEYIFLVRCALFDKIAYCDAPLVVYRAHAGSWGESNVELNKYRDAGLALVRRCGEVLRHPSLSGDLTARLLAVCDLHLHNYADKLGFANVTRGNFGVGAMYGSISKLFTQTASVRRVFVQAGGVDGVHANLGFAWFQCKYSLMIVRFIFLKWLRKPRTHD